MTCQMPAAKIDTLLDLWMSSLYPHGAQPPFRDHCHLYKVIDTTMAGDVRWQCFIVDYTGEVPNTDPPKWMVQKHEVWFCDSHQVNPGFMDEMDLQSFQEFSMHDHTRHYKDLMSGDWTWEQAVGYHLELSTCFAHGLCAAWTGYDFGRQEYNWQHVRANYSGE